MRCGGAVQCRSRYCRFGRSSLLSRHICYALHSFPYPHLRVPNYVCLGPLFYASGVYPPPFWAGSCAWLIWIMNELRNINAMHTGTFSAPQNGSTQATQITSGSMTELLHGSLGDTRFPELRDLSSTGYQTSRSAQGSERYINDRNSNCQTQLKPPSQSHSLWSPFEQRRDMTLYQTDYTSHDYTGLGYMRSQVSAYSQLAVMLELTYDTYRLYFIRQQNKN